MGVKNGGFIAIKIGESPIFDIVAGDMEGYGENKYTLTETFTANLAGSEGYMPLRIHLSRTESDNNITHYLDNIYVKLVDSKFDATIDEVRYQFGGQFEFAINAGPEYAHRMYLILQSMTGPYPGMDIGSANVHLPLEWDIWTDMALSLNPYWCNFYGILDHEGKADAQMSTFGQLDAPNNALAIHLVAVVFGAGTGVKPVFATNPVNVLVTKQPK